MEVIDLPADQENCDEIHSNNNVELIHAARNSYELNSGALSASELSTGYKREENNLFEISSKHKFVTKTKDGELPKNKMISSSERALDSQKHSVDPVSSNVSIKKAQHVSDPFYAKFCQGIEVNKASTTALHFDNMNNSDGNLNFTNVLSRKNKILDKPDSSKTGSVGDLSLLSNSSNFEDFSVANTSGQEAVPHVSTSFRPEKFRINPNPNDFDMLEENNLSDCSAVSLGTKDTADAILPYCDNSVVISNNNALPRTENIVSSNYSLSQLRSYGSDESLNDEPATVVQQYRKSKNQAVESDKESDSDSSSTSSSSSVLISESDSSESESDEEYENFTAVPPAPIKGKKELDLQDLPPIEDLTISVPEEDCIPVGKVYQIVEQLVVVQALKDMPAYDLDTVLFLQGGQPFGKIFDVFGPVTAPYYCVRFNSNDHIKEKNISIDQMVYCAPKTKYTNFVFMAQLLKLKGSDASWIDDDEPPEIFLDYSDDEQEQRAKKTKSRNRKAASKAESDPDEPARKRHFAYERRMNQRNLQLSATRSDQNLSTNRAHGSTNVLWASAMPSPGSSTSNFSSPPTIHNIRHRMFGKPPPMFNARVPPPNMPFSLFSMPYRNNAQFPAGPNSPNMPFSPPNNLSPGHGRPRHIQPPQSNFINPNSSHLPRPIGHRPPFPDHSNGEPYPFVPTGMPGSSRLADDPGSREQSSRGFSSSWVGSPPPRPSLGGHNMLPTSPLWIQRPPSPFNPNVQSPFPAAPTRPFPPPPHPQPRMCWPTPSSPQTSNIPFYNRSEGNFNPHIPPSRSPNSFY